MNFKKLKKILNGKNFINFIEDKDYLKINDINDLVELLGLSLNCNCHNYRFNKNGTIRCLTSRLPTPTTYELIMDNIDKLSDKSLRILLDWDIKIYELLHNYRKTFIINPFIFMSTIDSSKITKEAIIAEYVIDKYYEDSKNIIKKTLERTLTDQFYMMPDVGNKLQPIEIITEPFTMMANLFLCKYVDADMAKFIITLMERSYNVYARNYAKTQGVTSYKEFKEKYDLIIKNTNPFIFTDIDYYCLINAITVHNIKLNKIKERLILDYFTEYTTELRDEIIIKKFLNKIEQQFKV